MTGFFGAVAARLAAGERVFLALVAEHTAHSPGTAGARMAVFEDGSTLGTIGGGRMEYNLLREVPGWSGPPRLVRRVHRQDHPDASGLVCAGEQRNIYLVLGPGDAAAVRACGRCVSEDQPGRFTVTPDGFRFEEAPAESPQRALHEGPDGWAYTEQLLPLRRAALFGGGHCAQALATLLRDLGWHVTVFDDRPEMVGAVTVPDMGEAAARVKYPEWTEAVCLGTDLATDVASLVGILKRPFPFVGVMGAPAKLSRIRRALEQDPGDRLTAPVGLPIGSRTPQEIAVSIAAQLIARRAGT